MRKIFAVLGVLCGVVYTYIGMRGAYFDPKLDSAPTWRIILEFCVLSVFASAFFFAVGMGLGLIVEAILKLLRKKS